MLVAVPAWAHHSNSAFYVEKIIEVKGVITKWEWVNPHTFIYLSVDEGKGGKVEWTVEGRAPGCSVAPAGRGPRCRRAKR